MESVECPSRGINLNVSAWYFPESLFSLNFGFRFLCALAPPLTFCQCKLQAFSVRSAFLAMSNVSQDFHFPCQTKPSHSKKKESKRNCGVRWGANLFFPTNELEELGRLDLFSFYGQSVDFGFSESDKLALASTTFFYIYLNTQFSHLDFRYLFNSLSYFIIYIYWLIISLPYKAAIFI